MILGTTVKHEVTRHTSHVTNCKSHLTHPFAVSHPPKLTFHGAARTVTGSMFLLELEDGRRILLDCGLYQGRRAEANRINRQLPFEAASIDSVILSHAHMDHAGLVPRLWADGFRGKIWATAATRDLCALMLLDSARIQEADAHYFNRKVRERGEPEVEPLYTARDVQRVLQHFVGVDYDMPFEALAGIGATFRDAGHILGAATTTLDLPLNGETRRLGFTGDIGNPDPPILRSAAAMPDCDWLILESTYGGVTLPPRDEATERLREVVQRTVDRAGKVVIPAFAVGRTQEIVYFLNKLWHAGRLPRIPVFVDSPLAINATDIFRMHPGCFDQKTLDLMIDDPDPFGFEKLTYTRTIEQSKAINAVDGPAIIIASSGMAEAGRILHHLMRTVGDERNTILIVGFQAANTLGRRIVERHETVNIFGRPHRLRAEVEVLNTFSGHADEPHLLEFVGRMDRERLRNIFLVHGNPERQDDLVKALEAEGYTGVMAPERGESVALA